MLRFVCVSALALVLASCAGRSGFERSSSVLPALLSHNDKTVRITEYPLPFQEQAEGIAIGQGGAVWFASNGHMNRINQGGKITSFQSPEIETYVATSAHNSDPIFSAPDGTIWFIGEVNQNNASAITRYCFGQTRCSQPMRITASGRFGIMPIPPPLPSDSIYNIAPGPDGTIWVLYTQSFSYQYRLAALYLDGTVKFEKVLVQGAPFGGSAQPQGMVMGPDGAMYISLALSEDSSEIQRYDSNGALTGLIPTGLFANHMVVGPDDALWLTPYTTGTDYNRVERVSLTGSYTDFTLSRVSVSLTAITVGGDGAIWVADFGNAIWRITTGGEVTLYPMASYGSGNMFGIIGQSRSHFTPRHATLWFTQGNAAGKFRL